jgi:hypothetical protein
VTVYENETLPTSAVDNAKALLRMERMDKVIERAFGYFQAAWRLSDVPLDDPAIHKAVLSNCFLVLETISEVVTKGWREQNKADILSKQSEVVDGLNEKLDRTEGVPKKGVRCKGNPQRIAAGGFVLPRPEARSRRADSGRGIEVHQPRQRPEQAS